MSFTSLANPIVLLVLLAVGGGAWIYSRVEGYFETKAVVSSYQEAVAQRDQAVKIKDEIEQAAASQREKDDADIQALKDELARAQAQISSEGDAACRWTPLERQLLNSPQASRGPLK